MEPLILKMHPADNVGIVANSGGLPKGTNIQGGIVLIESIPQGHKVALTTFKPEDAVLRYNVVIGFALTDIPVGGWINESRLRIPTARTLEDLNVKLDETFQLEPLTGFTFQGYRNQNGTVGTRNILAITETVQCVAGVVNQAVKKIKSELLPLYPNVDDVVALEHAYGCGVAIDAPGAIIPIRTLSNLSLNPNFGDEVMVVSLGCEKLQPERLLPPGSIPIKNRTSLDVVELQNESHIGYAAMIETIVKHADAHLRQLNSRKRETVPASELVVGVQCGGSDAFSGLTANPAVGYCTDLLVRSGASVMFSEVTEVRDAIDQLNARAATPEVAQALIREMAWYDNYLKQGSVDRSANTTPGNKKGGLSNIVEKAMGSIVKSGSTPINDVLAPGERIRKKGLTFLSSPASDFVCGTLQTAAGMNLHVFTTGRGTPYGLAEVPVIKVATRTELAQRWHDLMDINAGTIATGEQTIEEVGWELFHLMLEVASGHKKTWAERWQIHNALTLFNPAPIT